LRYRKLPRTQILVSEVSFGTGSIHRLWSTRDRTRLLQTAFDCGITHFDTSPYYGNGLAEATLGHGSFLRRQHVTITTKFGLYPRAALPQSSAGVILTKGLGKLFPRLNCPREETRPDRLHRAFTNSLRRLRRSYVEFLFFHEPRLSLNLCGEILNWLDREVQAGRVLHYGLAGLPENLKPYVDSSSPLSEILQTNDSLSSKQADSVIKNDREFQFTFGYLSSAKKEIKHDQSAAHEILKKALVRNQTGSVIIATTKSGNLQDLMGATI
jgi:aryl-alcohol dehydrogenase-like predicted oxidoreductase